MVQNYILLPFRSPSRPVSVIERLLSHDSDEICISSITYAELMHGVEKSQAKERNRLALSLFLSPITILEFDSIAAEEYGRIRAELEKKGTPIGPAELEKKGTPIGPMDMLIAGHAKAGHLVLVTNNTKEFERLEGLQIENWAN